MEYISLQSIVELTSPALQGEWDIPQLLVIRVSHEDLCILDGEPSNIETFSLQVMLSSDTIKLDVFVHLFVIKINYGRHHGLSYILRSREKTKSHLALGMARLYAADLKYMFILAD